MAESKIVEGVVEAIDGSSGKSKKGGTWTSKRFMIDTEWYGGFIDAENKAKVTSVGEGDVIRIKVEKNAKGYWNYGDKFKIVSKGVAVNTPDGGTASLGQFTREYAAAIGKASGIVQGLCAAGVLKTPAKAQTVLIALGKKIMEEVWLATPETLGFAEVVEPTAPEAQDDLDAEFDADGPEEDEGFDED